MYIKPNTTAEVVCPYKGNQTAPITWRNSNTFLLFETRLVTEKGNLGFLVIMELTNQFCR